MVLERERLEQLLEKMGGCEIEAESKRYFVLSCWRPAIWRVRKAIIRELGYPAVYAPRDKIIVYREKPPKKVETELKVVHFEEVVDGESISVPKPVLCFKGSTFDIRDALKRRGFWWDRHEKAWCRTFESVSELRKFVQNDLRDVEAEAAGRGVELELGDLEGDWLSELVEKLKLDTELDLKSWAEFLATKSTSYRPMEMVNELAGDQSAAKRIEELARAWEDFGGAVQLEASMPLPAVSEGFEELCVRPSGYVGRDILEKVAERARELGMERRGGDWVFCIRVPHTRSKDLVMKAALSYVLDTKLGLGKWAKWDWDAWSYRLREAGVRVSREDIEELGESIWRAIRDKIEKIRERLMKVLE